MSLGMVGRKVGMTRVFTEVGDSVPVTVLDLSENQIAAIKLADKDGYKAIQVAFGERSIKKLTRSLAGQYKKIGIDSGEILKEFRVGSENIEERSVGDKMSVDMFTVGQLVDVSGKSKGRGFSGVIRKHNFSSNRASHGNSLGHNKPGSTGNAQDPGRVFPGKKMAGQYGGSKRTMQNLEVVRVDSERNLLMVKGAVAGSEGGIVFVKPAVKKSGVTGNGD